MSLDEWNARYRSREEIDDEPSPLLVDAAAEVKPGRALDLACGAGRNAVWLAHHGWKVTAVDGVIDLLATIKAALNRPGGVPALKAQA